MTEPNIIRYIRTSSLRRLPFPLVFLVLVLIIFLNLPIIHYLDVRSVSPDTPLSEAVNRHESYVRTEAADLYYTGYDYSVDGVLTGHYYYQLIDGYCRFYILKPTAGRPADTYIASRTVTGKIVKYGTSSNTPTEALAEVLKWSVEGLSAAADPYLINEAIYFTSSERFLLVIVVLCLLAGLFGTVRNGLLLLFPKLSAAYRRLGNYGDPASILADAEKELSGKALLEEDNMALTPKYLFEFSSDQSAIIPLESVLWVFRLENMKYSVKAQRDVMYYSLRIVTITGDMFVIRDRTKKEIDIIMDVLTDRYPNFFYGYSEEHDKMVRYILEENEKEMREKKKKKRLFSFFKQLH